MEYLMTYGWSILIIAIVLAALFSLGVFGNSNLGPRAQPNSCRVFRPNGPGTTTNINLEGVCNGELPQYVASFTPYNTYIDVGTSSTLSLTSSFTITAWINPLQDNNAASYLQVVAKTNGAGTAGYEFGVEGTPGMIAYVSNGPATVSGSIPISVGSWYFIAVAHSSSGSTTLYVNGVADNSGSIIFPSSTQDTGIGRAPARTLLPFNGFISNVQIYGNQFAANEIQSLYLEGIGGAPIEPQNLLGWWPLNGDGNDYSGNGDNGAVTANVAFISAWTSGYTQP